MNSDFKPDSKGYPYGSWPPVNRLLKPGLAVLPKSFQKEWFALMTAECHDHPVWREDFASTLGNESSPHQTGFALASVWSISMVVGSYCFPSYVSALASRADQDIIRHGLLENAWDESGGHGHTSRSHFWLAVRLAHLLGLSNSQIHEITILPEAQRYMAEHFHRCTNGDFGFALGMICLIEEFTTPEFSLIFKAFLRSCKTQLAMTPEEFILRGGGEYFTANISDDERHRQEMPRLAAAWLQASGVNLDDSTEVTKGLGSVIAGVRHSMALRQNFFHEIYSFVMNGGTYHDLIKA